MNSAHNVFAMPPRSRLRKRSPKIHHRHMNQAKKMKNSNIASRNDPLSSNIYYLQCWWVVMRRYAAGPVKFRRVRTPACSSSNRVWRPGSSSATDDR